MYLKLITKCIQTVALECFLNFEIITKYVNAYSVHYPRKLPNFPAKHICHRTVNTKLNRNIIPLSINPHSTYSPKTQFVSRVRLSYWISFLLQHFIWLYRLCSRLAHSNLFRQTAHCAISCSFRHLAGLGESSSPRNLWENG